MEITPKLSVAGRNPSNNPLRIIKNALKEKGRPAIIAGPMVRYSKLPFRAVCRDYNVDIVYTPMILAREFVRNQFARNSDFSTNNGDRPLIVQVGVNNTTDLVRFVQMVQPYVDGIGINCGCPVKEQVREGIGAALIYNPDLLVEMVTAVKSQFDIALETKIRVHDDLQQTVELCKRLETAGVDWITVHGRTKNTRSSIPVNLDAIKLIKESVSVPVVANGDCFSLADFERIAEYTKVDGIMAVRGLLDNPALFAGYEKAPWGCVEKFFNYATGYGLPYQLTVHHLACMLASQIPKELHKELNELRSLAQIVDFFDTHFVLKRPHEPGFGEAVEVQFRQP